MLLSYLRSMVEGEAIDRVEVKFMPAGHTHVKIDSIFSRCVSSAYLEAQDGLECSLIGKENASSRGVVMLGYTGV